MAIHRTADPCRIGKLVIENYAQAESMAAGATRDAELEAVLRDFAIVVCTRDEPLSVLAGVIDAVPSLCDCIVVSGSKSPLRERELIDSIRDRGPDGRRIWLVHQPSPQLADRIQACGLTSLLTERGNRLQVSEGKGEALVVGVLCAAGLDRQFVGFVDADNHAPESAAEYVELFARGMALRRTERCMVRLRWKGKRGVDGDRQEWGRASRISNAMFSQVVATQAGDPVEPITTGNAGEFAMTMTSAFEVDWTSRYGGESFLLLQYLEAAIEQRDDAPASEIIQILTSCDHCHTQKPEDHIARIIHESLLPLAHSSISDDCLRKKIEPYLDPNENSYLRYPSIASAGIFRARETFRNFLAESAPIRS